MSTGRKPCSTPEILSPALPKRQRLQPEWDTGMPDERGQQVRTPTEGRELGPEPGPQLPRVLGGVVRQPVVLRPAPDPLVRVRLRGVAGEVRGLDLRVLRQVLPHRAR